MGQPSYTDAASIQTEPATIEYYNPAPLSAESDLVSAENKRLIASCFGAARAHGNRNRRKLRVTNHNSRLTTRGLSNRKMHKNRSF